MSRMMELAKEFDELQDRLRQISQEISQELQQATANVLTLEQAPAPKRPQQRRPRQSRVEPPGEEETSSPPTQTISTPRASPQKTLKEVVTDILTDGPMEMKDIVTEVVKKIKAGEYSTKAKKIYPLLSQAIFNLKQEQIVVVEKNPATNKNMYSLSGAA